MTRHPTKPRPKPPQQPSPAPPPPRPPRSNEAEPLITKDISSVTAIYVPERLGVVGLDGVNRNPRYGHPLWKAAMKRLRSSKPIDPLPERFFARLRGVTESTTLPGPSHGRIPKWDEALTSSADRAFFEERAGDLLRELGYTADASWVDDAPQP